MWTGGVGAVAISRRRLAIGGGGSRQGHGEERDAAESRRDGDRFSRYARARRIDRRKAGIFGSGQPRNAGAADGAARKGGGAWRIRSRCCLRTITRWCAKDFAACWKTIARSTLSVKQAMAMRRCDWLWSYGR